MPYIRPLYCQPTGLGWFEDKVRAMTGDTMCYKNHCKAGTADSVSGFGAGLVGIGSGLHGQTWEREVTAVRMRQTAIRLSCSGEPAHIRLSVWGELVCAYLSLETDENVKRFSGAGKRSTGGCDRTTGRKKRDGNSLFEAVRISTSRTLQGCKINV